MTIQATGSPGPMADALKGLGLTSLAKVVPAVLERARQQPWSDETFLHEAVGAEVTGRAQRAYERRVRAATAEYIVLRAPKTAPSPTPTAPTMKAKPTVTPTMCGTVRRKP